MPCGAVLLALEAVPDRRVFVAHDDHLLPAFGALKLSAITSRLVETFKSEGIASGLCAKSVNNHLAVLRKCLNTAHDWEHLASVPRIRPLKAAIPAFDFLTEVECERLLAASLIPTTRAMILLALRTGLRLGEICALEWSAVDFNNWRITVAKNVVRGVVGTPKSNRIRHIPIADDLAVALAARRKPAGLVFPGPNGDHMTSWQIQDLLDRACKAAELRHLGWHALRHTFATQLAARGVPLRSVQGLLGHSTITMTERYSHLMPGALDEAIATLQAPCSERRWATGGQRDLTVGRQTVSEKRSLYG